MRFGQKLFRRDKIIQYVAGTMKIIEDCQEKYAKVSWIVHIKFNKCRLD